MGRRGARRRRRDGGVRRRGDPRRFGGQCRGASDLFAAARAVHERRGDVTSTSRLARGIPRRGGRARRHALIAVRAASVVAARRRRYLRAGADLNAKNAAGVAPVGAVRRGGHRRLADFLVKWAERHGVLVEETSERPRRRATSVGRRR